jgi:hypothetical protein
LQTEPKVFTADKLLMEIYEGGEGDLKIRAQQLNGKSQICWLSKEKAKLLYQFIRANVTSSKESIIYV